MPTWLESSQLIFIAAAVTAALSIIALWLKLGSRATARNMLVVALVATSAQLLNAALSPMTQTPAVDWVRDVVLVVIAAALLRMVGMVMFRGVLHRLGANPPRIVEDLTVTGVFLAWMVMWLRMSGVDFTSIVATSAVITAVIAFSMQETLGNILGGVALQLDHSIRIGDWVKIDDLSGRVVEIRWRFTAIETRNRETVVVPNSFLMKNRFTVIGSRADREPRWRRWVWFNVSTDLGVGRVTEVLERAVRDATIPHVATDPPPTAVLMEALPNGARFALRYWLTDPLHDDPTDGAVRAHALAALRRAGIGLIMPLEERMLIKENAEFHAEREAREQARRVGVLCNVDLFKSLSATETAELARHLTHAPFVKGDVITRQGAVAHWLYLVVTGDCEVVVDKPDGERKHVARLSDGSIFGEMGMMTGEPRRATVIAATDVECYRLDKEGFRAVLEVRPDLAQEVSRVLVDRNLALVKSGGADPGNRQNAQVGLINKIRAFFDLG
ncbi:MAG: mechanosensitive ion channel [Betaproteobacteria bacterium]|nr:mechanosensitive ion channel [Betaproteobacteria bacterium]